VKSYIVALSHYKLYTPSAKFLIIAGAILNTNRYRFYYTGVNKTLWQAARRISLQGKINNQNYHTHNVDVKTPGQRLNYILADQATTSPQIWRREEFQKPTRKADFHLSVYYTRYQTSFWLLVSSF